MFARLGLAAPLLAVVLAGGCGETVISISSDGRIEVTVSTSGADVDTDGFSVSVDGGTARFVAAGGSVTLADLSPGSHSVLLTGLAENCRVDGTNPRTVMVGSNGTATVAFAVVCSPAATSGFVIVVATSGAPVDPDGYQLAVAGGGTRVIAVNATEVFTGLTPGVHLVTLKDVDAGCALAGGNPQPFTVVADKTVRVTLTVSCGPTP